MQFFSISVLKFLHKRPTECYYKIVSESEDRRKRLEVSKRNVVLIGDNENLAKQVEKYLCKATEYRKKLT